MCALLTVCPTLTHTYVAPRLHRAHRTQEASLLQAEMDFEPTCCCYSCCKSHCTQPTQQPMRNNGGHTVTAATTTTRVVSVQPATTVQQSVV